MTSEAKTIHELLDELDAGQAVAELLRQMRDVVRENVQRAPALLRDPGGVMAGGAPSPGVDAPRALGADRAMLRALFRATVSSAVGRVQEHIENAAQSITGDVRLSRARWAIGEDGCIVEDFGVGYGWRCTCRPIVARGWGPVVARLRDDFVIYAASREVTGAERDAVLSHEGLYDYPF